MTQSIAINARQLSLKAGKRSILHGVDIAFAHGQWTAVVGPNGAGKSSMLKALAGLWPGHAAGQVQLLGQPLADWPTKQRARTLAWLGQNESTSDELTSYDVVMLGRLPHQAWLSAPSGQDHAVVEQALHTTHAWEWRHRPLAQLSGGERQRVLLARVLAVQAQVLLMDEPLANLDPPHQSDWLVTVRALVGQGNTVISVLHELGIALQADAMVVMQQGRMVHHGACSDRATHEALEAVFDHRVQVRQVDGMWTALPRLMGTSRAV